jgi:hypothetical protein
MFPYEDTPCSPKRPESGEIQALRIHFDLVNEHVATPVARDGVLGLCALVIPAHTDHCSDPDDTETPFLWPNSVECRSS